MTLVDGAGARAGKYTVDVRGAQGVQVGDRARQHNVFHAPPAAEPSRETGRKGRGRHRGSGEH